MAKLDLHTSRARKARFAKQLSSPLMFSLYAVGTLLLLLGSYMLVIGMRGGWAFVGLASLPFILGAWRQYDLLDIPLGKGGDEISQRFESSILGGLQEPLSPKKIAQAAFVSSSARFITVRFGLPTSAIEELSSDNSEDAHAVWVRAEEYRVSAGEDMLQGSMLIAALCDTQPRLKAALPHLQLDATDLGSGVRWFARIKLLIHESTSPKRTGGIARDWNFGYANLLERFGRNISEQIAHGGLLHVRLDSHVSILQQLQSIFGSDGRQNVALIGKLGAGKSTIVEAFAESLLEARSRLPASLKFRQVIQLDAGALIRAARNRNELESLVQQLFVEAFRAKNIILFLDDAQLFLEEGNGAIDLTSTLMPILEGGRLRVILAMDEQAYLRIAQRDPALTSSLNRLNVPIANEVETLAVMQDQIIQIEASQRVVFSFQALKAAYRLSDRYQYDMVQPGKSVRLLEQAARHAEQGYVTARSVSESIEQDSGVKISQLGGDDVTERETLLHMEDLLHERMVNQKRAVSAVSDALRRARAGVRNEKRPIGTFLFLGPTGVGKTELAKALAAVYFGGEDHLVRLNLNEYVQAEDVSRLIADGTSDPHSLTASVMKQPFSVVLLDEIEKAHPQVLTTLLQMLDEGILRDIRNRAISFRDCIIIATSNAGADRIRQLIDEGKQLENFEKEFVNELIDNRQFLPEFLNRFDEIVLFRPLNESELGEVVQRMIAEVNNTLIPQKVRVELTPAAVQKLAMSGYDPRLGARPMRRLVQRSVENLVAKRLLDGSTQPGDTVGIDAADIETE